MSSGKYKDLLKLSGFQSFLWTQFLGAFNDNAYKMIVSLFAVEAEVNAGNRGSGYLSLAGAVFILPFFLFSGYAGYIADVYNKRSVLIVTKSFEIVAMGMALFAFWSGKIEFMLAVLFLMALQSTFFSPAKYGIIPEMLPYKDMSRANGLLEMSTFLAIIIGTSIGGIIFGAWKERIGLAGFFVVIIAVIGTITSLGISKVPPSGAKKPFRLNPWAEIASGMGRLYSNKVLFLTVLGISYLWFLGALLQMDIILLGKEVMRLDEQWIGILIAFLAIGIGIGSIAAGRLSGDRIEPGLVPLGSLGMGIFSILLSYSTSSFALAAASLILLGISGGLFVVPLNALLQQRSGEQERGRLIATNNFINTAGILLASGVLWVLRDILQIQADRIALIAGLLTFVVAGYVIKELPDFLIRFVFYILVHTVYRVRVVGGENVPLRGPALLVCNHISFVDPFLVGVSVPGFIRFLITRDYYDIKSLKWFFRLMKAIPVSVKSRRDMLGAIAQARNEFNKGNMVCIFAEGEISRTGNIRPFKRGFEKMVEGLNVPIIPVYLDRVWGSIFSFKGGKFFYKWPENIFRLVTVSFGKPLSSTVTAQEVRQAIMELGSEAVQYRRGLYDLLHLRFVKSAKRNWSSFCMADSSGRELTYGKALARSLILAGSIRRRCRGESMVGMMLPASVGGALANISLLMSGKVSVNLNFTAGREAIAAAVQQCGIKTILTSRLFLEKAKIEEMEGMVFLEDVMQHVTPAQKAVAAFMAYFLPASLIRTFISHRKDNPEGPATVIFSSGSTGVPKGIMLSHHNILSNVEGISQVFQLTEKDKVMGILPFFHSFGLTATIWFPIISGFGAVYHPNPTDAKTIGEMISKYKATILISTPTFCWGYLKKCTAEEFSSLRYAIVGAEKLQEPLARAFKEKYGIDLLEGYGCTEMGPVVSVNTPDVAHWTVRQTGHKPVTAGHPIPGVVVKIVNPNTGETLPCGKEGMLLVKGPGRMMGYLGGNNPPSSPKPLKQVQGRGRLLPSPLRGEGWVRGLFSDEPSCRQTDTKEHENPVCHPEPCAELRFSIVSGSQTRRSRNKFGMTGGDDREAVFSDEAIQDGWYITGDIASIDEDGFITISDRLSRFSKIGGEMIPHIRIEDAVNRLLKDATCVVTSIPDDQRGERLVVLHNYKEAKSEDLWRQLCEIDLPRLWIPGRDDIHYIETIPTLGTGKVDLRQARIIAGEITAGCN